MERYPRKKTRRIMVGSVPVGGDSPITVQSMTTTKTADVDGTLAQIYALKAAGADITKLFPVAALFIAFLLVFVFAGIYLDITHPLQIPH